MPGAANTPGPRARGSRRLSEVDEEVHDEGVDQGFNAASADTIRIFFAEQVLDSIAVQGGAQGTYYPSDYKGKVKVE